MRIISRAVLLGFLAPLTACGANTQTTSQLDSRSLSVEEARADFDEIATAIASKYGPKEYKERRFNYKLADVVASFRQQVAGATTDAEIYGIFKKLLTSLHDGHVSIQFASYADNIKGWSLPVSLAIIEGKAMVDAVEDRALADLGGHKIKSGDLLVSIDGRDPLQLLDVIKHYESAGNDESDKLFAIRITNRPAYIPELAPQARFAHLVFLDQDGRQYEQDLVWRPQMLHGAGTPSAATEDPVDAGALATTVKSGYRVAILDDLPAAMQDNYVSMGQTLPFFVNETTKAAYHFAAVTPDADHLTAFGLTAAKAGKDLTRVYAALYHYNGKDILLVRQPDYEPKSPANSVAVYQALLSQYESIADVLVIDQTHNPGGDLLYALDFFKLFNRSEAPNFVQANHADRAWIEDYRTAAEDLPAVLKDLGMSPVSADATTTQELALRLEARAKEMEVAYDAHQWLAPEAPFLFLGSTISGNKDYTWKKPVLLLADDMAGSCGDIFPMMMQRSGVAKIFGKRTMGLGGNVEAVVRLSNSGATVRMTRGLYTTYRADGRYSDADKIENNGVSPDYPYEHSVADFRAGFVGYVKAFSDAAVQAVH